MSMVGKIESAIREASRRGSTVQVIHLSPPIYAVFANELDTPLGAETRVMSVPVEPSDLIEGPDIHLFTVPSTDYAATWMDGSHKEDLSRSSRRRGTPLAGTSPHDATHNPGVCS